MPNPPDLLFKALADPTRRALYERLSINGELTVRALTDGTLIGYTVKEFRQRLGARGIHELIEHRTISVD